MSLHRVHYNLELINTDVPGFLARYLEEEHTLEEYSAEIQRYRDTAEQIRTTALDECRTGAYLVQLGSLKTTLVDARHAHGRLPPSKHRKSHASCAAGLLLTTRSRAPTAARHAGASDPCAARTSSTRLGGRVVDRDRGDGQIVVRIVVAAAAIEGARLA